MTSRRDSLHLARTFQFTAFTILKSPLTPLPASLKRLKLSSSLRGVTARIQTASVCTTSSERQSPTRMSTPPGSRGGRRPSPPPESICAERARGSRLISPKKAPVRRSGSSTTRVWFLTRPAWTRAATEANFEPTFSVKLPHYKLREPRKT